MSQNTPKKASQEDWHPADIKAALNKAGWTLSAIAKKHGLRDSTVLSHAFSSSGAPASERRIAAALGVAPISLWPSRWNEDGTQKPRGHRALQCSAMERARNGEAADKAHA
jgi:lambda repressor-like predicted transcriptional regulator